MDTSVQYYIKDLEHTPEIGSNPIPQVVELYVSDKCHLRCKHCFLGDIYAGDTLLSIEEWQQVIDQFFDLGVRHFHVAGREPFHDEKGLQLLKYLDEKKRLAPLKYGVITHGLVIHRYIDELRTLGIDYLDFSLDGLQTGHEFLRGHGTYARTRAALENALEKMGNEKLYVSSAACQKNADEIPTMLQELSQSGLNKFFVQPIQPFGFGLGIASLLLTPNAYAALIDQCVDRLASSISQRSGIIFFVPMGMLPEVCAKSKYANMANEAYSATGVPVIETGNLLVKFRFEVRYPAYNGLAIITPDGYYIGSFEFRSLPNYKEYSLGNIRDASIEALLGRATLEGGARWALAAQALNQRMSIQTDAARP